jgi:hypothetical protein
LFGYVMDEVTEDAMGELAEPEKWHTLEIIIF